MLRDRRWLRDIVSDSVWSNPWISSQLPREHAQVIRSQPRRLRRARASWGWRSAVAPLVNVARFRQAAAAVVLADPADAALAPRGAVVCLPPAVAGPGQGIALEADPAAWPAPPAGVPLVTTLGPVRGGFAECRAAVGQLTAALARG